MKSKLVLIILTTLVNRNTRPLNTPRKRQRTSKKIKSKIYFISKSKTGKGDKSTQTSSE